ncbi:MAG: TonB-dependent receptor [Deltaproteobacteria bacterium]|nr:TonB-dependent receptor [Deltaproteobacteria bacterium]
MKLLHRTAVTLAMLGAGSALAQPQPEQPAPDQPATPAATVRVFGRVIDALGRPVRNATIRIEGQPDAKPIRTGRDGTFSIDAPIGATLVVEQKAFGVGLATVTGASVDDIVLLTESQLGETIEIDSEAPAVAPGAAQLDRKELQRIPGTGGDIVKALTAMPGVVNLQIPLGYSGVVIRGSSPQDSKVLIDDFEVPVLFHNVGFRAVTPAETIQSLDYIPGGFDVGYGRASSGIVSLTTRPGDEKRSAQAEISVIDGGLLAQGSIGAKTRYMAALRRSTIDFVLPSIIPDSVDLSLTTVPRYWDEQLRIDHEINKKWNLTISNVGTDDIFELYATKDEDAATKRFFNRTRFARLTAAARYKDGPWNAKLALSGLLQQFVFEAGLYQRIEVITPMVTPRADFTHTSEKAGGLTNVQWRFGGELQAGRAAVDIALPIEQREGETMAAYDPKDVSTKFNGNIWIADFTSWGSVSANLDRRIRGTVGVRTDYYGRGEELVVQPRGELKVQLTKPWQLRLAAGAYSRPPQYQSEFLQEGVQAEKSKQVIFGGQYEPRDGARVQASVYYTDRTDLITHNMDNSLGNNGRGTTTGAELLATYRGGPWFAWLSYSYSHSTRVDAPGAERRLFSFDQPHSANAAVSWQKGRWQLGGRFQLYSGLPYTPVMGSVFDNDRNLYIPLYADVNSERAPIHHQLDLRIDYSWKWGPTALTAFLDVQNVYLNESVVTYFYSYDFSQRIAFKSLPLIPSIGIRGVL